MARTKQSADKSTGEPAPREPIPDFTSTAVEGDAPAAQAPEQGGLRRSQRKRKDAPDDIEDASAHKLIKITVASAIPINHIEALIPGRIEAPVLRYDKDHDMYCCACRNGGNVHPCGTCLRSTCNNCIIVPESPATACAPCPYCYLTLKDKKKGVNPPYEMLGLPIHFIGNVSTREFYPRCTSEPLAVISITLQGFADSGPPRIVYESLIPYLKTHICYIHLDYSLSTKKDAASYYERSSAIVDLFTGKGAFAALGCRQFSVFLASHSDPERGDLHFAPKSKGANKAAAVLDSLFGGRFGEFLGNHDSELTLLVCGSIVTIDESLEEVKNFYQKSIFKTIIGFTQPHLMGNFCEKFLADRSIHRYIHLQASIDTYVYDHQALGSHTDVIFLETYVSQKSHSEVASISDKKDDQGPVSEMVAIRYRWSHGTNRPFGHTAPLQCNQCYVLRPWHSKLSKNNYILKCQSQKCSNSLTYQPFEGAVPVLIGKRGLEGTKDDRGVWYKQLI